MTTTLITGTTHGIGLVTARELARDGHRLVLLCRNLSAAETLRAQWQQQFAAEIQLVECDLASLSSVRRAADAVLQHTTQLDQLINNAGRVCMQQQWSADGFELTFATNHLGPFLLTELLRPALAPTARIINLASKAHRRGTLDLGSVVNNQARYFSVRAYDQSKLATVLHTLALARRLQPTQQSVTCLHPGVIDSNLLPRWVRLIKPWITPVTFDNERGAHTTLMLARSSDIRAFHGGYVDEHGQLQSPAPLATDLALQEALWSASEHWVARWR